MATIDEGRGGDGTGWRADDGGDSDAGVSWRGDEPVLRIDCAECVLEGTSACVDCVVSFLVGHEPGTAVLVDAAEVRALRALARGGLAPTLRHRVRQPV